MPTARTPISVSSFTTFGDLLRYLRTRERLTQRDLSIAVGYSEAQISRLEGNQRPPDLSAVAALLVPALDLRDEHEVVARLLELAAQARGAALHAHLTITRTVKRQVHTQVGERAAGVPRCPGLAPALLVATATAGITREMLEIALCHTNWRGRQRQDAPTGWRVPCCSQAAVRVQCSCWRRTARAAAAYNSIGARQFRCRRWAISICRRAISLWRARYTPTPSHSCAPATTITAWPIRWICSRRSRGGVIVVPRGAVARRGGGAATTHSHRTIAD